MLIKYVFYYKFVYYHRNAREQDQVILLHHFPHYGMSYLLSDFPHYRVCYFVSSLASLQSVLRTTWLPPLRCELRARFMFAQSISLQMQYPWHNKNYGRCDWYELVSNTCNCCCCCDRTALTAVQHCRPHSTHGRSALTASQHQRPHSTHGRTAEACNFHTL